ncbi:hypothetical protein CEXT_287291 [Caerostris extrusa]|uniref:Uncharacterized protein n=1 Tax=Caerostris extrusa TaxID=172846 RepID=A0AAV4XK80_CAEEX|nr:hypothetical protein CEXT_287291 [Caerostris extrusa]
MAEEEPDGHLSQPRSLTSFHPRQINSRLLDKSSRGVQNLPSATLSRQRHRKSNGLHLTGCILNHPSRPRDKWERMANAGFDRSNGLRVSINKESLKGFRR